MTAADDFAGTSRILVYWRGALKAPQHQIQAFLRQNSLFLLTFLRSNFFHVDLIDSPSDPTYSGLVRRVVVAPSPIQPLQYAANQLAKLKGK